MKRRTFVKSCAAGALAAAVDNPLTAQPGAGTLADAFRHPPSTAYAKNWWHWMNGNISAIGITRDLEAMKRVGIGGFQIFQVGSGIAKGPINYGSPEHIALLKHAAKEADRLGLEFVMHNCPGWSSSGGPWIPPELSMQVLTWTETPVAGGRNVSITLPKPKAVRDYYRDAMVLAYPSLAGEQVRPTNITTSSGPADANLLSGAGEEKGVEIRPAAEGQSAYLQLEFAEPFEARSILVSSAPVIAPGARRGGGGFGGGLSLEASDDGAQFRKVCDIAGGMGRGQGPQVPASTNFAPVRAKYFRLVSTLPRQVSEIRLFTAQRVENWAPKANFGGRLFGGFFGAQAAAPPPAFSGPVIDPSSVLDITGSMDQQGRLNWQAPAGHWTVLRIGHTTTGAINAPGPDGGIGLECDKFSKAAYDFHFNHFFGELFDVIKPLAARGLAGAIIDSYETGMQNWSAEFPQEFQKRRGYDLKKYMPAMLGKVVGSPEESDGFLWDIRKTQGELMNDYYYGRFVEDCHQRGMRAYIEPYDPGNFDEMTAGAHADTVMGEFWLGQANHHSIKLAASVAHVNGKRIVAAESFTGQTKWQEYPYCMKTTGDFMYAQGLNNYVFHRYCHQPHPDVRPGMTMGPWGWYWDRTNTWFDKAGTWLQYVSRAQNMLRQGLFVADLLYFTGEDSPQVAPPLAQLDPPPPPGYDWDTVDGRTIFTRIKIDNGKIVFPDGMSYRVLVLRDHNELSLEMLRKVRELVNQGMILVGPKPEKSPSLADNASEVRRIAAEVWGNLDGKTTTERAFGKGRVYWGHSLRDVLEKLGVKPDFEFTAKAADAPINWLHRRAGDAEIYFLATRRRQTEELVCSFRVDGKRPEFWNAVTGEIAPVAVYEIADGRTRVPVRLEPAGSLFIVFRSPAPAHRYHQIAKDGKALAVTQPFATPAPGLHRGVTNNFTVSVWVKPDMDAALPQPGAAGGGFGGGGGMAQANFIVYPPAGEKLYGANHVASGLNAGRNGVVVYERAAANPVPVLTVRTPLAGWTHLAVVYKNGAPSLYVNGKAAGQSQASGKIVHPGLGEAYQSDGAAYFMGHMSEPELFSEALAESRIEQLAGAGVPKPEEPPAFEPAGGAKAELLFWQDGQYTLRDNADRSASVLISGIGQPVEIAGPWRVTFPPDLGAPAQITLPELISLHRHSETGVKYFSGTATYTKRFTVPANALAGGKRLYLDLGRVEVIAEVKVNGKEIGNVWKPPYRLDITGAVRSGENDLEVQVTNLWGNRLIGDEQLPPEYEYGGGMGGATGGIRAIPDWYAKGQPKPPSPRITFTTWKWYSKDDALFESGLIGPVRLRAAVRRPIES